jgi:hypothetical protein
VKNTVFGVILPPSWAAQDRQKLPLLHAKPETAQNNIHYLDLVGFTWIDSDSVGFSIPVPIINYPLSNVSKNKAH